MNSALLDGKRRKEGSGLLFSNNGCAESVSYIDLEWKSPKAIKGGARGNNEGDPKNRAQIEKRFLRALERREICRTRSELIVFGFGNPLYSFLLI